MMPTLVVYQCYDCGAPHEEMAGRCKRCGHWFSVICVPRARAVARREEIAAMPEGSAQPAELIAPRATAKLSTGIANVDRLLAGGLVPSTVTVVSGRPGSGKSRLVRQIAANFARRQGRRALLVSAEEPANQVRVNLDEMGLPATLFHLAYTDDLAAFEGDIFDKRPSIFVFDSLQYLDDTRIDGGPATRRMEAFKKLREILVQRRVTGLVISHVNSEGEVAADRNFERLPDVHLFLGEPAGPDSPLRELEIKKSRFHAPGRVTLTMTGKGLV